MKRVLCALLAAALLCSLCACGGNKNEVELPTVVSGEDTGRRTLTIGLPASKSVSDYVNNYFTQMMERRLDAQLKFMLFDGDAQVRKEQLTALVDGGHTLPDILLGMALSADDLAYYGDAGHLVDLAPYFDDAQWALAKQYGWHEKMTEYGGEATRQLALIKGRDTEGRMYGWPSAAPNVDSLSVVTGYINRSWLDKLGLAMPTTWEELVDVLCAFRDKDPNDNGITDEIPMVGSAKLDLADAPLWVMNQFGMYVYDSTLFSFDQQGELYLPHSTDAYRQGLVRLNELVDEKLLSPVTWTVKDKAELANLWTPASGVSMVGVVFGDPTQHTDLLSENLREYEPLPALAESRVPQKTKSVSTNSYITTACADVDLACEFLLSFCDLEVARAVRYGEPGVDWEEQTDLVTGKPMVRKLTQDTANKCWHISGPVVGWHGAGSPFDVGVFEPTEEKDDVRTFAADLLARGKEQQKQAAQSNPEVFYQAAYNEAERDANGSSLSELKVYVKESRSKFAAGQLDVNDDAVWQEYLSTLERLGLSTLLTNTRAALARREGM